MIRGEPLPNFVARAYRTMPRYACRDWWPPGMVACQHVLAARTLSESQ